MKILKIFILIFILSFPINSFGEDKQCFDAKSEKVLYEVLHRCYIEVPKVNVNNTTRFPECHAMRTCYAAYGVFYKSKGNVCIKDYFAKWHIGCRVKEYNIKEME